MTKDDLKPILESLISRTHIIKVGKAPICLSSKTESNGFSMEISSCAPRASIKELVNFAIEESKKGKIVTVICSNNQVGHESCEAFNSEVFDIKSSLMDYSTSDSEL